MSAPQNLTFWLGEDWIIDHTSYLGDGVTPLNLAQTGAYVQLQVRNAGGLIIPAVQGAILSGSGGGSNIIIPSPKTAGNASPQLGLKETVAFYAVMSWTPIEGPMIQNTGTFTIKANAFWYP
jgi:hypothetical protein